MVRGLGVVAAAAALSFVVPEAAQAQARDGRVEQAVADTVLAAHARRGLPATAAQTTVDDIHASLPGLVACGLAGSTAVAAATFYAVMRCLNLNGYLAQPVQVGGGDYGGGGATGAWDGYVAGQLECDDFDYRLDAALNLVIPALPLSTGARIDLDQVYYNYGVPWPACNNEIQMADSPGAVARRAAHCRNMGEDKRAWVGALRVDGSASWVFSSLAYYDEAGVLHGRTEMTFGGAERLHTTGIEGTHRPCPETDGGGSVHYYGMGPSAGHLHTCVHYVPDYSLSPDGYALSPVASLPATSNSAHDWPNMLPEHIKHCPLSAAFLRALTDALWRQAADQPGFDGSPPGVEQPDARPGDATVEDLGDQPGTGTTPPEPNPATPPPPDGGGSTGGSTDTCDFGPGGCDDPGTGAPSLEEPPTGIMDPIFDWLPDLPSITLTDQSAQCPTWTLNLTAYGGTDWIWLFDGHCTLVETDTGHGTVRSILSVLMVAVWGMAAALVILRA